MFMFGAITVGSRLFVSHYLKLYKITNNDDAKIKYRIKVTHVKSFHGR